MHYPWRRFWCQREGTFRLGMDGYLLDPEDDSARYLKTDAVRFERISEIGCLALLGDPGIGKSTVLEDVVKARRAAGINVLHFDLHSYSSEDRLVSDLFEGPEFLEWRGGEGTLELFIDSLDECMIHIKTVAALLVDQLRNYQSQRSRFRMRIACREADWPELLEDGLKKQWGAENYRAYELLPLRRRDVVTALEANRLDVEAIMDEFARRDIVGFAINPLTLQMLIDTYLENAQLPTDQRELFEDCCLRLCREMSSSRRASGATGNLDQAKRLAVGKRIAAMTLFGGKTAVYTSQDEHLARTDGDVTVSAIVGGSELAAGVRVEVDEAAVREVLGTHLFSGRGGSRRGWAHQSYGEYLAACYLSERGFSEGQIDDILFLPAIDGKTSPKVVPQLQVTAAWVAAMNQSVMKKIIQCDPQVLLTRAVNLDNNAKARIVDSLLRLAESWEITDSDYVLRGRYDTLKHPDIGSQLEPVIADRSKHLVVRRMAIDLAEECKVEGLCELLADIALDKSEDMRLRRRAVHLVSRIRDATTCARLRGILDDSDNSRDQELLGWALSALWPEQLSAGELFDVLVVPSDNVIGSYHYFLRDRLIDGIASDDLPAAVRWVAGATPDRENRHHCFEKCVSQIMRRAWNDLDADGIVEALADAILVRVSSYQNAMGHEYGEEPFDFSKEDSCKRRRLFSALVSKSAETGKDLWMLLHNCRGLATPLDLAWLLRRFQEAPANETAIWADVVVRAFDREDPRQIEAVWQKSLEVPELAERVEELFDTVFLDSDEARENRDYYEKYMRAPASSVEEPARRPPTCELVSTHLELFHAGDIEQWWMMNLNLMFESNRSERDLMLECEPDLKVLPGWTQITQKQQEAIVDTAVEYLCAADPEASEWLGSGTGRHDAEAGCRALVLLLNERPEELEKLPTEVWKKWAPALLGSRSLRMHKREEFRRALLSLAYRKAPDDIIDALMVLIDAENEKDKYVFVIEMLDFEWDRRLTSAILDKIKTDESLSPKSFEVLLRKLVAAGDKDAVDYARGLLEDAASEAEDDMEKARRAGAVLMAAGGQENLELLMNIIERNPTFGKEIVAEAASRDDRELAHTIGTTAPEDLVARLFKWLMQQFPPEEDSKKTSGVVSQRDAVGYFRENLIRALCDKGTQASYLAICNLAAELPDLNWLKHLVISARTATLKRSWQGVSPEHLLKMAEAGERRLVRSGQELLLVIQDSLERLHERLQGENSGARDLWNENTYTPKNEDALSDYVTRFLEDDLQGHGIVVNREVQIRRGEETDIHVDAMRQDAESGKYDTVSAIIEAKGCWHKDLKTAMKSQLVDRYLRDNQCPYGLYLVGWFLCDRWSKKDYRKDKTPKWTLQEARAFFAKQARELSSGNEFVSAFVLDSTLR